MKSQSPLRSDSRSVPLIRTLRGQQIILGADSAALYQVETRTLTQAVKRNADRFPSDFLFQLAAQDIAALRSQSVISTAGKSASTL